MADTFQSVSDLYLSLEENFNDLFSACKTDAQKTQLRSEFVTARDAYYKQLAAVLKNNDPLVQNLIKQLGDTQKQIDGAIQDNVDITQTLTIIGTAVSLATRIMALAA